MDKIAGPRSRKPHLTRDGVGLLCRRRPREGWEIVSDDDTRPVCSECSDAAANATPAEPETETWMAPGTNVAAFKETIRLMTERGEVDGIPVARLFAAASLADAVDRYPQNAALWRRYLEVLDTLVDNGTSDEFTALLEELAAPQLTIDGMLG